MWATRKHPGFTIVELLIVVVVIGILAAIVIVAYNGITESARATSVADAFRKIEKSMTLYVTAEGYASWPVDNTLTGSGNPTVSGMISSVTNFSNYLQSAPAVADIGANTWRYDNDGDVYNGCAVSYSGTNIYVNGFTDHTLALKVDEIIDDGDLSCGKMRLSGNDLIYSLSNDGAL